MSGDVIADTRANELGYSMLSFQGLGILEIGLSFSYLLFGVIISQCIIYLRRYSKNDPKPLRYFVRLLQYDYQVALTHDMTAGLNRDVRVFIH